MGPQTSMAAVSVPGRNGVNNKEGKFQKVVTQQTQGLQIQVKEPRRSHSQAVKIYRLLYQKKHHHNNNNCRHSGQVPQASSILSIQKKVTQNLHNSWPLGGPILQILYTLLHRNSLPGGETNNKSQLFAAQFVYLRPPLQGTCEGLQKNEGGSIYCQLPLNGCVVFIFFSVTHHQPSVG